MKSGGVKAFSYIDEYSDSNFIKTYFERLANGQQGIYYLTFMVILVVLIIIRLTIFDCLSDIFSFIQQKVHRFWSYFKCCRGKSTCILSNDIYKEFNMMYLESIYFKAKEDLDDLEDDIKDEGAKWEQYDSHRMDDEVKFSPEDII